MSTKPLNFRMRFEAWHKATFGYCTAPKEPFTAFSCQYPDGKQQARWEGWQANSENSYQLGHNNGAAHHKQAVTGKAEP
jgi:hypothetical protein